MPVFWKAALCALSMPLLASAAPMNGTVNDGMPPERFQGAGAVAVVVFTDRAGIDANCGVAQLPARIIACTKRAPNGAAVIFMPNACGLGHLEYYAKIVCHEVGHVQGWGPNHED